MKRHFFTTGDKVYVIDHSTMKKIIAIIDDIDDTTNQVLVHDPDGNGLPIWISMCEVRGKAV